MKENEDIQPPAYIGTPTEAELQQVERMLGSLRENENNTHDVIHGIGASSGIVSGRVKSLHVLTNSHNFKRMIF